MNKSLQKHLENYIYDTRNPEVNFYLGVEFEKIRQYASSLTHYLKCAELSDDQLLQYEAQLRIATVFNKQGGRVKSELNALHQAIPLAPDRPEGYYLIADCQRRRAFFTEALMYTRLGKQLPEPVTTLRTDVGFPKEYGFEFEEILTHYHRNGFNTTRSKVVEFLHKYSITDYHRDVLVKFMNEIKLNYYPATYYTKSKIDKLRVGFEGVEGIEKNYAQAYQDMFVLMSLNGQKDGTYLEIGSGDPTYNNNTKLLEELGWTGISIDLNAELVNKFNLERSNRALVQDATTADYGTLLQSTDAIDVVDYLQVDCEPAYNTYQALLRIPFTKYQFKVITFEHDHYTDMNSGIRRASRELLSKLGYKLVVNDISTDRNRSFEDWWVHPDYISEERLKQITSITDDVQLVDDYMYRYL